jgi:hypothetical protein
MLPGKSKMQTVDTVRQTIIQSCVEFIEHPYLCYTEHGQHALFYTKLYNALPLEHRYTTWQDKKVSVVQKEYSTAGRLDKTKRQHWDIAVIKTPAESIEAKFPTYDYLKLAAVVEFGMNATLQHLKEDVRRLIHQEANVIQGFIVHLHRLSKPGTLFSNRDRSSNSTLILTPEEVTEISRGKSVEIFYAMADSTGKYPSKVWSIKQGEKTLLKQMV